MGLSKGRGESLEMSAFKRIIVFWVVLLLSLSFFSGVVLGGEACTLRLRQAYLQGDEIRVYLDILDEREESVQGLSSDDLKLVVNLGQNPGEIMEFQPFAKTKEGVAYIFLVDISKSLSEAEFQEMKKAMGVWVDALTEQDRVSVVTFGESVRVVQDFTGDHSKLLRVIDLLSPTDLKTQLHRGLARAIELGRRSDPELPTRRVIVTLSDGQEDYTGGMVKDEVLALMEEDRIPIYALGFYRAPLTKEKQKYLDVLGEFARRSGGDYWQMNSTPIPEAYSMIRRRILGSYVVTVDCRNQVKDGGIYHLRLNLTQGGKTLSDGLDLRLLPTSGYLEQERSPETVNSKGKWILPGLMILGIVIVGSLVVVCVRFRSGRNKYQGEEGRGEDGPDVDESAEDDFLVEAEQPDLPGIKLEISITGKNEENQRYQVKLVDRITIGREKSGNELSLADKEISRRHCELTREGDRVFIRDLASRNGTFLNGVPITGRHRVESGDLVLIGRTELRVGFEPEARQ